MKYLILLIFSHLFLFAFSQEKDTIQYDSLKNNLKYVSFNDLSFFNTKYSQDYLFNYQQKDFTSRSLLLPFTASFLSNLGQPVLDKEFADVANFRDFYFNSNQFIYNTYLKENNLIVSDMPYSELFYMNGSQNENFFYIQHAQNIKKKIYAGFKYNIINSNGFFERQISNIRDFTVYIYSPINKRYSFITEYNLFNYKNMENGGLISPSDFKHHLFPEPIYYPVHLSDAHRTINKKEFIINQFFNVLGNKNSKSFVLLYNRFSGELTNNIYIDNNPNPNYYPVVFDTNMLIHDSLSYQLFYNEFGIQYLFNSQFYNKFQLAYHTMFQHFETDNNLHHEYLNNITNFRYDMKFQNTSLFVDAQYVVDGYYKNNFIFSSLYENKIGRQLTLGIEAKYKNVRPSYLYNEYSSDLYQWKNDFGNFKMKSLTFNINLYDTQLKVYSNLINNFYFFNFDGKPSNSASDLYVSGLKISKNFVFGKFELKNNILLQHSSDLNVLSLPLYIANHNLIYNFTLRKGMMKNRIGFEIFYNSKYLPDAYYAYHGDTYSQYTYKYGNYPYIDFYVATTFKRATVFVKLQHLNSGINGYDYFVTSTYPNPPRSFKFGVSWLFWD